MVARGNSLTVELARRDFEHETSKCYKGFVVRSRLKRVLNEVVKLNVTAHEEEVRRFPGQYIDSIKFPDGHVLQSNREIRDAFWMHFHDCFARCTDLLLQEFSSYLAGFSCLRVAEAASCKGVVTEYEIHDALMPVGHNKSPGLGG